MRRTISLLLGLLLTAALLPAKGVKLGVYLGGFAPRDEVFKSIYGSDADLTFGLEIGLNVWRGFSLRLSVGHFERNGETSFTGEISRLRLYPLSLGLRYTLRMRKVQPYIEVDYHHLLFRESAAIGDIDDQGSGYALVTGAGFPLSSRFSLELFFRYTDVSVTVPPQTVQMGGLSAGFAFLVRI